MRHLLFMVFLPTNNILILKFLDPEKACDKHIQKGPGFTYVINPTETNEATIISH